MLGTRLRRRGKKGIVMDIIKLVENLRRNDENEFVYIALLKSILKIANSEQIDFLFNNIIFLSKKSYQLICSEYSSRLLLLDKSEQEKIVHSIPKKIDMQTKYFPKIRLAYSLLAFNENKISIPNDVLQYFINSSYYSIRKIGYLCLDKNHIDLFLENLIKNYDEFDDDILHFLLDTKLTDQSENTLKTYLKYYMDQDYLSFQERIDRNNILIKICDLETEQINNLKETDPISYVYIMKSIHKYIDTNYLYNMFYSFEPRKTYLLGWFIELGNHEVIDKIALKEFL